MEKHWNVVEFWYLHSKFGKKLRVEALIVWYLTNAETMIINITVPGKIGKAKYQNLAVKITQLLKKTLTNVIFILIVFEALGRLQDCRVYGTTLNSSEQIEIYIY